MKAKEFKEKLLDDPCVSHWLKEALQKLDDRDPIDALKDLDLLKMYFGIKIGAL